MSPRNIAVFAAVSFVLGLVEFFAAMGGPGIALGMSLLLAFLSVGALRLFEVELENPWYAVIPPVAAGFLGVLLWSVARARMDPLFWLAPLLAAAVAALIVWWKNRDERRCALCNAGLSGRIAFTCPRCNLVVCESKCWDFEKIRCRLCVQNAVPLFAPSKQWWDRYVGPVTTQGRCQRCQVGPEEAELRTCPKCGRPQCLECWDDANGVCARCAWRVEALPESLKVFMHDTQ